MYQTCTRLVTDLYQTALYIPFLQPMATLFLFVFLFYSFLPFFPFLGPQPFTFLAGGYIRRDSQRLLEWQPVVECRTNPCEDAPEPPQQPHFHARTENTTRTTANTTTIATPENRNMQYDWWIVALCCIWDFGGRMWMCVRFLSPCSLLCFMANLYLHQPLKKIKCNVCRMGVSQSKPLQKLFIE